MATRRGGSWQRTALHVDGKGQATCTTYPDRTPVLALGAGNSIVSVCLHADKVTAESVDFARELAKAAQVFAVEIERRWRGLSPVNNQEAQA
ncbi:hypothetical protein [Nonomuraea jiangxiensis]|uniref:Uncharacterized protein n=1 Tax=Nonomuraea jiangxiensis TaxID=633440 RepID=A0A1G8YQL8_9ACTN|nr:hypothetical protein [Nonomuraea jiangxiensis]SDK04330.1 hypothetical protein SAMN05421869_113328 [Nonomuraea jiangxiensis]